MKIKIRSTNKGHCVDYRPAGGQRTRRFFHSKSDADAFAKDLSNQQKRGGELWLAATGAERLELITILDFCRTNSIRPIAVLDGYRSGSGATPLASLPVLPLSTARTSFLDALKVSGKSIVYREKFGSFLSGFSKGRDTLPIASITTATLSDYLAPRTLSAVSRNSYLKRFSAFFAWHLKNGNISTNPTSKIDKSTVTSPTPFTLSVQQSESVLRWTQTNRPDALCTLTLLLFVGLRPAESSRVTPDMFRLEAGTMHLQGTCTKTGRARSIQLQPAAVAWFQSCQSLVPLANKPREKFMQQLAKQLGFSKWKQDCLRHTAASFLLSLLRSADQVSLLLGNGTDILNRHYIDAITPADCTAFWAIAP
jgi:integrase